MPHHALLVVAMYCILTLFTSFYINSESNLAAGLFTLTVAVIATGDLSRRGDQAQLAALWLLSLSTYESWAIFFPVAFGLILLRNWHRAEIGRSIYFFFGILYLAGFAINVYSIVFSPVSENRTALLDALANPPLPILTALLLFLVSMLLAAASILLGRKDFRPPWSSRGRIGALLKGIADDRFLILVGLAAVAGCAAVAFNLILPHRFYGYRPLNLTIPIMFAAFFVLSAQFKDFRDAPSSVHGSLVAGVLALLVVTSYSWLSHVSGFVNYRQKVLDVAQANGGFIPLDGAISRKELYHAAWTYPTLSLLVQGLKGKPVESVIYDPKATWQPYGPADEAGARNLISKLGTGFDEQGFQTVNGLAVGRRR
jgi:hypothetical protein